MGGGLMWTQSPVFKSDLDMVNGCGFIPWENLRGKTVLVTGATGLIGYALASALLYCGRARNDGIRVLALVRDMDKARRMYSGQIADGCAPLFIEGKVEQLPAIEGPIDYIVHGASPTASAYFVQKPVETIMTAVLGTRSILELARQKHVQSVVFLSSMEAYGANLSDDPVYEDSPTFVNTSSVRNCYPQAKQLCENLCVCYCSEYGVPAKAMRLAQTFGAGVPQDDRRVFAQFARSAMNKENIVLQTAGESRHSYLYTADAVSAILTVLLKGESGQVYNAANPAAYCSIREMAQMVADEIAGGDIQVEVRLADASKYPATHRLNLCADKLMALGWKPTVDLPGMYRKMLDGFSS